MQTPRGPTAWSPRKRRVSNEAYEAAGTWSLGLREVLLITVVRICPWEVLDQLMSAPGLHPGLTVNPPGTSVRYSRSFLREPRGSPHTAVSLSVWSCPNPIVALRSSCRPTDPFKSLKPEGESHICFTGLD